MELEKIKKYSGYVEKFSTAVGTIAFAAIVVLVLMNVVDVFMAQLFNTRFLGSVELSQRFLMCAVFGGFAYAQSKKAHITMTLIIVRLPRVLRFVIFTFMSILSLGVLVMLTYAAFQQTGISIESNYVTEVLKFPLWPFYVVECISLVAFCIAMVFDIFTYALAIFREDVAEMVQEQWT